MFLQVEDDEKQNNSLDDNAKKMTKTRDKLHVMLKRSGLCDTFCRRCSQVLQAANDSEDGKVGCSQVLKARWPQGEAGSTSTRIGRSAAHAGCGSGLSGVSCPVTPGRLLLVVTSW